MSDSTVTLSDSAPTTCTASDLRPVVCVASDAHTPLVSLGPPPVNTVAPALSGSAVEGQTLSCSQGTWTNSPTSYTYQWKRNGSNIGGATSNSYALTEDDAEQSIKCTVTASNAGGSTAADSNTATPATNYPFRVLADGPSLYWRLGEATGTNANDETANNRDGTYGAGVTLGATGALAGDSNTAITLNDSSTGVVTSGYAPFVAGTTRTFEAWVHRTDTTTTDAIFGGPSGSAGRPTIGFSSGGTTLFLQAADGGGSTTWAAASATAGAWHHVVVVFNQGANTAEAFIDGVSLGSNSYSNDFAGAASGNFQIGYTGSGGNNGFKGRIDEVAVYESALSPARIAAHYAAGT